MRVHAAIGARNVKRLDIFETRTAAYATRVLEARGYTADDAAILGAQLATLDCRAAHMADGDRRDAKIMRDRECARLGVEHGAEVARELDAQS
jgi:hypothetical protein